MSPSFLRKSRDYIVGKIQSNDIGSKRKFSLYSARINSASTGHVFREHIPPFTVKLGKKGT